MSLMKYSNLLMDDKSGVLPALYGETIQEVSWNPYHVWLHDYAIDYINSSRYLMWLRSLVPVRSIIFKYNYVTASKELKEKINSWL